MLRSLIYDNLPGTWIGEPVDCDSISTDTRTMQPGALYVAVAGKQADGHQYIPEAIRRGARAVMVTRVQAECPVPQWVVADAYEAICFIVRHLRDAFQGDVVAVTGSVGKTSTKQFIAQILARRFSVLSTTRNWNTEYGLAQLFWGLAQHHQCIVLEMGAKHPGDIATLCRLVRPTVGVVTNVQHVHSGLYPSFESLIETKMALLDYLSTSGKAAISVDDPLFSSWIQRFPAHRCAAYGQLLSHSPQSAVPSVTLADLHLEAGEACFRLIHGAEEAPVHLHVLGKHQVGNALAAAAVTSLLGVSVADVAAGLSTTIGTSQRLMRYTTPTGGIVYDDTYNGNGALVAIAHLALDVPYRTTIFVMTDMADLQPDSVVARHEELCRVARDLGVHHLWCLGPAMKAAMPVFGPNARHFEQQSDLIEALIPFIGPQVSCLIKGSRGRVMERVVQAVCPNILEKTPC
ncbi:MAG: UDP-N-acetylmuramoyl-tripeptide--D-alanyl-D-alanine ligase [Pseudomonadota bacterium]